MSVEEPKPAEEKKPDHTFEKGFHHCQPRCWRNKDKTDGRFLKVVPWFGPLGDDSRFDFKGLMKDCFPELMKDDVMKDFEVYSGLVMQIGWMIENENRMWFGLVGVEEMRVLFDDLGPWKEAEHAVNRQPIIRPGEPEEAPPGV